MSILMCEGGHPVAEAEAVPDLSGGWLCKACAADSEVACDICGGPMEVKLYPTDGTNPDALLSTVGIENYVAVCWYCDNPESTR